MAPFSGFALRASLGAGKALPFVRSQVNRLLSSIGLVFTVIYCGFLVWLFDGRLSEIRSLPPNSIGDVLAGAFGPLAIVWLVLGFFQQGVELRQNTRALELQAEELKNSVNQQRELVRLTAEQLATEREAVREERRKEEAAVAPRFLFVKNGHSKRAGSTIFHFSLVNTGGLAAKVTLSAENKMVKLSQNLIPTFESQGERSVDVVFPDGCPVNGTPVKLGYMNSRGAPREVSFSISVNDFGIVTEIAPNGA